eukprot:198349_1
MMNASIRTPKSKRRRFAYTETDQRRWLSVGAILVASAATLGYLYGRFGEKNREKNSITMAKHDAMPKKMEFERDYRIVIFGDSTTWGYDPDTQTRLKRDERYPCILEKQLNSNDNTCNKYRVEIVSEGLNGRTINHDDAAAPKNKRRQLSMNGTQQILQFIYSHKPLDIIILMLGINDCKERFNASAVTIADSMNVLIEKCTNAEIWRQDHGQEPSILLISPPSMRELQKNNKEMGFTESSIHISNNIHTEYAKIASKYDHVDVFNANDHIETGSDSIHIDAANNIKLANALYPIIVDMIHKLQKEHNTQMQMSMPSFLTSLSKH